MILAARYHAPGRVDDALEGSALLLITFSMVTVGLVAAFVWDALAFDRRDAMVLGPLPLRGATVVSAKLAALALFLLVVSTGVNVLNAFAFALETGDGLGSFGVIRRFVAVLAPSVAGAIFVFSAVAALRGAVALSGRPRLNAALGSLMQFVAVTAVLLVVVMPPAIGAQGTPRPGTAPTGASATNWMPQTWFLGLFEAMRGSPRHAIVALGRRAIVATPLALVSAVLVLIAGYRRQMRLALTPAAFAADLGRARLGRAIARLFTWRDGVARATADFILLTLARSRVHRAPVAINVAIGATLATAALASRVRNLASVTTPRTATLWIPLLMAYWIAVGLRASFFVPAELPAAWSFRVAAPERRRAYWSSARASVFGAVTPPALGLTALLVPFVGWRVAAWHALVVVAMVTLLSELVALTVDFIPFTRPYHPGHAKLKTRWWLYALGIYVFAYWPARWELSVLARPGDLLWLVSLLVVVSAALEIVGRLRALRWTVQPRDEEDDEPHVSVLALGGAIERA